MDFVLGLLKTARKYVFILVVDCFARMTHFLPCFKTSIAFRIATIYFDEVVRLHGSPKQLPQTGMLSSRVTFGKPCGIKQELKLLFSIALHPQIDSQTEVVYRSLGNPLQCLVGKSKNMGSCVT